MNPITHNTAVTIDGLDYVISVRAVKEDRHGGALLRQMEAAPELLAALSWFIDDIDGKRTVMAEFDANVNRARAAIAKAEGLA